MLQTGHTEVAAAYLSPDGRHVVTAGTGGVGCWDVATGRQLWAREDLSGTMGFRQDGDLVIAFSSEGDESKLFMLHPAFGGSIEEGGPVGEECLAVSPDARSIAAGSRQLFGGVLVYDVRGGTPTHTLGSQTGSALAAAFSPDGRHLVVGTSAGAQVWDLPREKVVQRFHRRGEPIQHVAFSPDGNLVLLAELSGRGGVWRWREGRRVGTLDLRAAGSGPIRAEAARFSPDGTGILVVSSDRVLLLDWNVGTERLSFAIQGERILGATFVKDALQVLTTKKTEGAARGIGTYEEGGGVGAVRLWDVERHRQLQEFRGLAVRGTEFRDPQSLELSADARRVVILDDPVRVLDLATGAAWSLVRSWGSVTAALSPDGRWLAMGPAGEGAPGARLWHLDSANMVRSFEGRPGRVTRVGLSNDGERVMVERDHRTIRVWEAAAGEEICKIPTQAQALAAVAISPDGRLLATCTGKSKVVCVWSIDTGKETTRFGGHAHAVSEVMFMPDGRRVLSRGEEHVRLWDSDSGEEIWRITHEDLGRVVSLSLDGLWMLTRSPRQAFLWDLSSAVPVKASTVSVMEDARIGLGADARHVVGLCADGRVVVWAPGRDGELVTSYLFHDGSWTVVDPDGRFDAPEPGHVSGLHWVIDGTPVGLEQTKSRYWDPGLLAKHLGLSDEPLRDVPPLAGLKPAPGLEIRTSSTSGLALALDLESRGGGIGKVEVFVNGQRVVDDARPEAADPAAEELRVAVDVAGSPQLRPGDDNEIEVRVWNREETVSRGPLIHTRAPGVPRADERSLWAVVVGTSDYAGVDHDLEYAAKDAEDFARALDVAARRLLEDETGDRVHLQVLTTSSEEPTRQPTLSNVRSALASLRSSGPEDTLVVFLSGHGLSHEGADPDYYYLTQDAGDMAPADPRECALAMSEIEGVVRTVPASRRVLILDTCGSGRALSERSIPWRVPGRRKIRLEDLTDQTGFFLLSGCAADERSYEASRFRQGLLTYALLEYLVRGDLDDGRVAVTALFEHAANRVPQLAREVGVRQDTQRATRGPSRSFPIGRLLPADRAALPVLSHPLPVFTPSKFLDMHEMDDVLGLGTFVDQALRVADSPRVVLARAAFVGDGYRLGGLYEVTEKVVVLHARLFRGVRGVADLEVRGSPSDKEGMVGEIVRRALEHVR